MNNFKNLKFPVFFPDATRAVLKSLDSTDIKNTHTPGVLVNTWHLYNELGPRILKKHGGVKKFMNWDGGVISDSGGFQVMSLVKKNSQGSLTDEGIKFPLSKKSNILFTPELSIQMQTAINPDMMVVLDDFTPPIATFQEAKITVDRTIAWAKRSKNEFLKQFKNKKDKPYLLGVIQGGKFPELRKFCAQELIEIGFDGFGYGGWPMTEDNKFDLKEAKLIADLTPKKYFLYGLGIGKPEDIVACVNMGYHIFDCVLPTRDARHGRLYVYTAKNINSINVNKPNFYEYFTPTKSKYLEDKDPVSKACDCHTCQNYSRGYLTHLFKIGDTSFYRLATIHNLRFYSILMEKLQIK